MPRDNAQGAAPDSTAATTTNKGQGSTESRATNQQAASDSSSLMNHLGIPEDVQAQIRPKQEKANQESPATAGQARNAGNDGAEEPADTGQSANESSDEDANVQSSAEAEDNEQEHEQEQDGEEDVPDTDAAATGRSPFKDPRVQKRLGREARKRERIEQERDRLVEENDAFRAQLGQVQQGEQEAALAAPVSAGLLGRAQTEPQLNALVADAKNLLALARRHPDGMPTTTADGKEGFIPPDKIKEWEWDSQDIITGAESRRTQIREFGQARSSFQVAAREDFPDWFDETGNWRRDTPEFQSAVAISNRFPELKGRPEADYYLCALVEGFNVIKDRRSKMGDRRNGKPNSQLPASNSRANGAHRDIDERAFGPRVPIAPHTASSTARDSAGLSSHKKVDQAMEQLVADPDGGAASLAKVFAAAG